MTVLPVLDASLYSELKNLDSCYQDLVIDAGALDAVDTKTALMAAHLVVIPLRLHTRDRNDETRLIRRIEAAKVFNPGLRTLIVVVRESRGETADDVAAASTLAKAIPSSSVAQTTVNDSAGMRAAFDDGLTVFESQPADERGMKELEELGLEVFGDQLHPEGIVANVKAAGSFLNSLETHHRVHLHR